MRAERGGQQIGGPESKDEAPGATGEGEHEALGEELADDAAASAAEREADGNLLAPGGATGEEHIGEVETGDEQHEAGHAEQERAEEIQVAPFGRGAGAGAEARQGARGERLVLLLDRVGFLEVGGERAQGGLGGGGRHAGLEAADDEQIVGVAAFEGALGPGLRTVHQEVQVAEWEIELGAEQHHRAAEILRRDADDRERALVDTDSLADEVRIETGLFPVEVAGDDDRRSAAGLFLFGQKAAALHERHPERAEIVRADNGREGAAGGLALADADHGQGVG